MKISHKKCYEIAEKFCKENDFIFIGFNNLLKGNRMEISVGRQGYCDDNGELAIKDIIIGYGTQEVECEEFIYNVIRNDNDCGTDSVSLFNFKTHKEAVDWIKTDIDRTMSIIDTKIEVKHLVSGKDYWVYDNGDNIVIDWSIRKLPLQDNSTWTDPDWKVKYKTKS